MTKEYSSVMSPLHIFHRRTQFEYDCFMQQNPSKGFVRIICGVLGINIFKNILPNFQLIFTEQNVASLPAAITNMYHSCVNLADLSNNGLKSLNGLQPFVNLTELILDNNHLGDIIKIPRLPNLTTLSLNNNNVSFATQFTRGQNKIEFSKLNRLKI